MTSEFFRRNRIMGVRRADGGRLVVQYADRSRKVFHNPIRHWLEENAIVESIGYTSCIPKVRWEVVYLSARMDECPVKKERIRKCKPFSSPPRVLS